MDKDYEYKVLLIDWFEGKQAQCKPQTLEKLLNTGWEIVNVSGSNTRYQAIIRKLSNPTPEEDDSDIDKELKDHGFPDMGWLDQGIKDYVAAKDKEIAELKQEIKAKCEVCWELAKEIIYGKNMKSLKTIELEFDKEFQDEAGWDPGAVEEAKFFYRRIIQERDAEILKDLDGLHKILTRDSPNGCCTYADSIAAKEAKAYDRGCKQGVEDEIKCVETSGEHAGLVSKLQAKARIEGKIEALKWAKCHPFNDDIDPVIDRLKEELKTYEPTHPTTA